MPVTGVSGTIQLLTRCTFFIFALLLSAAGILNMLQNEKLNTSHAHVCFKIYHNCTIYVLITRLRARDMVRSVSPNFSKQVRSGPFGPVRKIDMTFGKYTHAMPKSVIFTSIPLDIKILLLDKSQWMTSGVRVCRYRMPNVIWYRIDDLVLCDITIFWLSKSVRLQ